jgi:hypothetical protein
MNIGSNYKWMNDELNVLTDSIDDDFRDFIKELNQQTNFQINPASVGRFFYNLAKADKKNKLFEKAVINEVEQWRDQFSQRLAFGFFYGALRLNADKNLIYFARTEYEKFYNAEIGEGLNFYYGKVIIWFGECYNFIFFLLYYFTRLE